MKLLVCGGRTYGVILNPRKAADCERAERQEVRLTQELDLERDLARKRGDPITHVIQGGARGADLLAGQWAVLNAIQNVECAANWFAHGQRAGFLRNGAMLMLLEKGRDKVIAFPGGNGTADTVAKATKLGHYVVEIRD